MDDSKIDKGKARIKEAAGDLTGDRDLKREGKADCAGGEIKERVGDARDWVEDKSDQVKDR